MARLQKSFKSYLKIRMKITIANKTELEEILAVQKKAFIQEAELYQKCSIAPMTQTLDEIIEECQLKIVLKAELDGRIIGSIRAKMENDACHINKLIVLPEHQGKGFGKRLLLEIEKYFPKAAKFALETGAKSVNNIALYQKVGYKIVDRGMFHDGVDAVIMEKVNVRMTILDEINANKKLEVEAQKARVSIEELKQYPAYSKQCPSLKAFLLNPEKSGIIAEHKRQSPSKGIINGNVNLKDVVTAYEKAGASAVSVLTDSKYFGGNLGDLKETTSLLSIPVLRKDFIVDEYQIHEAKAYGAAIILLIAASLSSEEIDRFAKLAHELGMEVLFEVHNEDELKKVSLHVDVIGVNNRDLKTFKVDIEQSIKLAKLIPDNYIKISESGISNPATVLELKTHGFQGFLMGENFMKETNPGLACEKFIAQIK